MASVTLKILHGSDRGKVFETLVPPFTVGREEGNDIQLNDERVSRCHFKVQQDNDRLVLTDLDSTNGTKVNGVECSLKILRSGDLISVGRSLMLVGSDQQINARFSGVGESDVAGSADLSFDDSASPTIIPAELPSLPSDLSPGQKAQVGELVDHLQTRLHRLIESALHDDDAKKVHLDHEGWQRLIAVQSQLAQLSRHISDPQGGR